MSGSNSGKKIVLVDFDGTLITHDSLTTALAVSLSPSFVFQLFRSFLKNTKNWRKTDASRVKEMLVEAMFNGLSIAELNLICKKISTRLNQYDNLILLQELDSLKKKGFEVYIVTASPVNWVLPWAQAHGIENVIGTELNTNGDVVTGGFLTPNCKGAEKVRRIETVVDLSQYDEIIAYGNSKDDYAMLGLAHSPFWVDKTVISPWRQ